MTNHFTAPGDIQSDWVADYLVRKYNGRTFGKPVPFSATITMLQNALNGVNFNNKLFGTAPNYATVFVGQLQIIMVSTSQTYEFQINLYDLSYSVVNNLNNIFLDYANNGAAVVPVTVRHEFGCVDFSKLDISMAGTAANVIFILNGYKVGGA